MPDSPPVPDPLRARRQPSGGPQQEPAAGEGAGRRMGAAAGRNLRRRRRPRNAVFHPPLVAAEPSGSAGGSCGGRIRAPTASEGRSCPRRPEESFGPPLLPAHRSPSPFPQQVPAPRQPRGRSQGAVPIRGVSFVTSQRNTPEMVLPKPIRWRLALNLTWLRRHGPCTPLFVQFDLLFPHLPKLIFERAVEGFMHRHAVFPCRLRCHALLCGLFMGEVVERLTVVVPKVVGLLPPFLCASVNSP